MIKTVVFDFDGTIADTLPTIIKLFNQIAKENDLPIITKDNIDELKNSSASDLIRKYKISPLRLLKFQQDFYKYIRDQIENIPIHKGISEIINKLRSKGLNVGILTSNSKEIVEIFLAKNELVMDFVWSEKNIFGKGEKLVKLIKKMKLLKTETIYVGDEVRDIEAVREAELRVVSVTWGMNSEERLRIAKPDWIVTNPMELIKILQL